MKKRERERLGGEGGVVPAAAAAAAVYKEPSNATIVDYFGGCRHYDKNI